MLVEEPVIEDEEIVEREVIREDPVIKDEEVTDEAFGEDRGTE